jgi:hypothetical protein
LGSDVYPELTFIIRVSFTLDSASFPVTRYDIGGDALSDWSLRDFKPVPYTQYLMTSETNGVITGSTGQRRLIDWTKEDTETYEIRVTPSVISDDSLAFS